MRSLDEPSFEKQPLMAAPSSLSTLHRIKHELKEWERTFLRLHGRTPSKDDIKASPSIHALYKDYARVKAGGALRLSENYRMTQSQDIRETASLRLMTKFPGTQPSSPGVRSASSCSDESHVSATPPQKKYRVYSDLEPCGKFASYETRAGPLSAQTTRLNGVTTRRSILADTVRDPGASKHNEKVAGEGNFEESICKPEPISKLAFNIKMQHFGGHEKENICVETLQGCCPVNSISFSLQRSKSLSRRVLATAPISNKGDGVDASNLASATGRGLPLHLPSGSGNFLPFTAEKYTAGDSSDYKVDKDAGNTSATANISANVESPLNVVAASAPTCQEEGQVLLLSKLTVVKLRKLLQGKGLPLSGNKSVLVDRLAIALSGSKDAVSMASNSNGPQQAATAESSPILVASDMFPSPEKACTLEVRELLGPTVPSKKTFVVEHLSHRVENASKSKRSRRQAAKHNANEKETELPNEVQGEIGLQACRGQAMRKSNGVADKVASRRCNVTDSFVNWHTVSRIKNQRANGNFVKLNMGKKGYGSRRFVNFSHKRKGGAYNRKYKNYRKKKQIYSSSIVVGDEVDHISEDELVACHKQTSGDSPSLCPSAASASELVNKCSNVMDFDVPGLPSMCSASAVTEALNNPTEINLLRVLQLSFGHAEFRPGQLEAIQRTLLGQSTMLVLPTGAGKSLCFQLPAYLLPGLTLVISPLVALMVDQLQHLPPFLPGAVMSSIQTSREYSLIVDKLRSGKLKVLFVSPERFLCNKFLALLKGISPISLAVVDEVHCMSEWSHNFRPSYFRLGVVLREKLNLGCGVLAMTATATRSTLNSVMESLQIPFTGLVQVCSVRKNLVCTASRSVNRCNDLLSLLKSEPFQKTRSIIVYCNFQFEAENISLILRDNGFGAKSYHGGMDSSERKRTQELFCSNKLRVVVATVAFGLGLDKSDVDAVIHYGFPTSLENYVQEIGRAGRDGKPAHCHMLLDEHNFLKLRSLAYSDNVDEHAIKGFLCKAFSTTTAQPEICSLAVESAVKELDLKEEVMATTLSYLEVGDTKYVSVFPQMKTTCTLRFHKSSPSVLAKRNFLVDALIKRSHEKQGEFVFEMPSVANVMGLKLPDLQQQLQDLQVAGEVSFSLKNPAFCFSVLRIPNDMDMMASKIAEHFSMMEDLKVRKLDFMYEIATTMIGRKDGSPMHSSVDEAIQHYFLSGEESACGNPPCIVKCSSSFLKADIKVFLNTNPFTIFSSRAVARILHGISSPAYPSASWSKNHFWGRYCNTDFNAIKNAASAELKIFGTLKS